MRNEMPNVTAFIDAMREAFGKEMIDRQIKRGMRGEPVFYAKENGHEVGTPMPPDAACFIQFDADRWERKNPPKRKVELSGGKKINRRKRKWQA